MDMEIARRMCFSLYLVHHLHSLNGKIKWLTNQELKIDCWKRKSDICICTNEALQSKCSLAESCMSSIQRWQEFVSKKGLRSRLMSLAVANKLVSKFSKPIVWYKHSHFGLVCPFWEISLYLCHAFWFLFAYTLAHSIKRNSLNSSLPNFSLTF